MARLNVPLGADAERARMLAAERHSVPWRRWGPSIGPEGLPGIVDEEHGIRLDLAFGRAGGGRHRSRGWAMVEHRAATPTSSFLESSVELPAGADGSAPCLLHLRFAKRAPEDIVIALSVVAGFGSSPATVDLGVTLCLAALAADLGGSSSVPEARQPFIRSAPEVQGPGLPDELTLVCAERPGCGTWWLAADGGLSVTKAIGDGAVVLRQRIEVAPGEVQTIRLRLTRGAEPRSPVGADAAATLGTRAGEAAAYIGSLQPGVGANDPGRDTAALLAELAWAQPAGGSATDGIMSSVALAVADPVAARQRLLACLEGRSPVGTAVEPPLGAWAASRINEIGEAVTGRRDHAFLERAFHALLDDYSRWVDRVDPAGRNALQGGLLDLDGTGSSAAGTAWMACYGVWMLSLAIELARDDPTYQDVTVTFLEMSLAMVRALDDLGGSGVGMWDEADHMLRDVTRAADGEVRRVPGRSTVGLVPLLAVALVPREALERLPDVAVRLNWSMHHREVLAGSVLRHPRRAGRTADALVSLVPADRWIKALSHAAERDDVSPAMACLLMDAIDRVRAFDADGWPVSVGQALAARLAADPSSPAWATLLMRAMHQVR